MQAVGRANVAISIEFQFLFFKDGVQQPPLLHGEEKIGRLRRDQWQLFVVRLRKIGQRRRPSVPHRRLKHLANGDRVVKHRRARWRLPAFLNRKFPAMDSIFLHFAGRDFRQSHLAEIGEEMDSENYLMGTHCGLRWPSVMVSYSARNWSAAFLKVGP